MSRSTTAALVAKLVTVSVMVGATMCASACIKHDTPPPARPTERNVAPRAPVAAVVTLTPAERHQTLEGFGASLAWYQDRLVPNPPRGIYETLFPELGLDILRLRNRYGRVIKPADGNLAEDAEIFKQATAALGHAPRVMMSSWTPPAGLKANQQEDCHGNADCTLARENGQFVYEKFAAYWRESLLRYAEVGIVPEWVSIENEPSYIPPSWEGCRFDATETAQYPGYGRALAEVHKALATLPNPPKLLGPEVLGIHYGTLQSYLKNLDESLIAGVAHHLYERGPDKIWDWFSPGPDSFIDEMQAARAATTKPLFQTEFNTDEDRGTLGGFETAWLIHLSLVEESAAAFFYWDLIWGKSKGLVDMDSTPPRRRDHYFSVRHYARYTDPGDVRVGAKADVPAIRASAFLAPGGDRLTVVLLNTGDAPASVRVDPGAFASASSEIFRTVYRPPTSETWTALGALPESHVVWLPERSVATLVLRNKAPSASLARPSGE